jgi:Lon-like ATP-dependent protease
LGPAVFDVNLEARSDKFFPPGKLNILTVSGMVGSVLSVECCFDLSDPDKKGFMTASGNLKTVIQESLKIAKINALSFIDGDSKKGL